MYLYTICHNQNITSACHNEVEVSLLEAVEALEYDECP